MALYRVCLGIFFSACAFLASPAIALENPTGSGTGFFVNADGWVVTNAHVVEQCTRVSIVGRGDTTDWKIDSQNDLAVVYSPGPPASPIVVRKLPARLGEDVAALGYPLMQILSNSLKITTGNVNSLLGIGDDTRYLQISTPIQPGNSGGPLVDRAGALLGITSAVLKDAATGDSTVTPQNVNFAVRSSVLELFLQSRSIQYPTAEVAGPAIDTADLVDKISSSVVQILCYGASAQPPEPSPNPIPEQQNTAARVFQHYENQDVIGFDYRSLTGVTQAQCVAACESDLTCKAVTYNKPAHYCFMKNDAVITVRNSDASGSVLQELAANVRPTTFSVFSGTDQMGGDYLNLHQMSFVGCFVYCAKDDRCHAFAYVRKKRGCWLKDASGNMFTARGVDLGVK